jgi:hypothetical protein
MGEGRRKRRQKVKKVFRKIISRRVKSSNQSKAIHVFRGCQEQEEMAKIRKGEKKKIKRDGGEKEENQGITLLS